jgi:hypothetical protein
MRTITQHSEVLDLPLAALIVDDTDTPMQVIDPNLLGILAGPFAGQFRILADPDSVTLPVTVRWEPVS